MTFVKLIPEIQLLVIHNRKTKESKCYPLTEGTTKSLCDEFQDAVSYLDDVDPPLENFQFRVIEPDPDDPGTSRS